MLIAGAEAVPAGGAVIIGALQAQSTQYTLHLLHPATDIARRLPATAIHRRTRLIGKVGIETLLNRSRCQPQGSLAKSHLQRLEIQLGHRLAT